MKITKNILEIIGVKNVMLYAPADGVAGYKIGEDIKSVNQSDMVHVKLLTGHTKVWDLGNLAEQSTQETKTGELCRAFLQFLKDHK
ncbi:MAG: hypothetical protein ACTSW1_08340 [Candidatus Hodarchaeales archaeon]